MSGIRASPTSLRDADDDYSYHLLITDVERLKLLVYKGAPGTAIPTGGSLTPAAVSALLAAGLAAHVAAANPHTQYLRASQNLADLFSAGTARTNLGLGSIATQAANNVNITGGAIALGAGAFSSSNVTISGGTFVGSSVTAPLTVKDSGVQTLTIASTGASAWALGTSAGTLLVQVHTLTMGLTNVGDVTTLQGASASLILGPNAVLNGGAGGAQTLTLQCGTSTGVVSIGKGTNSVQVVDSATGLLGFFGTAAGSRITQAAPSAIVVTGSAGAAYTATEQTMINALVSDVTNLRSTLNTLISNLRGTFGYGLFG